VLLPGMNGTSASLYSRMAVPIQLFGVVRQSA
jgi:hypothetical protein